MACDCDADVVIPLIAISGVEMFWLSVFQPQTMDSRNLFERWWWCSLHAVPQQQGANLLFGDGMKRAAKLLTTDSLSLAYYATA